jgi:hypothetical protein
VRQHVGRPGEPLEDVVVAVTEDQLLAVPEGVVVSQRSPACAAAADARAAAGLVACSRRPRKVLSIRNV